MSAARRIMESLMAFKRATYDLYPLLLLIPFSLLILAFLFFPEAPKPPSTFSAEAIIDAVLLVVGFIEALMISRYDRWVVRPLMSSSIRFRELFLYWIIEPILAIGISLLGLITVLLLKSWAPLVPYVSLSYTAFLIISLRLKSHLAIIDQRLKRLGGALGSR